MTYICVSRLAITGSDNGLSPGRRQAIIWTYDWVLLIGPFGTNFSKFLIENHTFSFWKMHVKIPSTKWRQFVSVLMCLLLNRVLKHGFWLAGNKQLPIRSHASLSLSININLNNELLLWFRPRISMHMFHIQSNWLSMTSISTYWLLKRFAIYYQLYLMGY